MRFAYVFVCVRANFVFVCMMRREKVLGGCCRRQNAVTRSLLSDPPIVKEGERDKWGVLALLILLPARFE